ncbi:agmatinase family protein [Bacillus fonticola]|uniref:agmatinase family protein n=1 Tax=Bacillus fonticola TaxID=2728853 RepID=UPI001474DB92|nr:agmatinase family protein [Bacillus fonticola]
MKYPYPFLTPPPFQWTKPIEGTEPKVHEWVQTIASDEVDWATYDVAILGVPLSRSSISASAASEHPLAFRRAWSSFTTYNLDEEVDLADVRVVDVGDVRQHVTDIQACHQNIREAMVAMQTHHPHVLPIMIGGDHSITAMLVKGWQDVHEGRIGILQLDTHFDLRDLRDQGPSNGTPVRNLIENGVVKGEDVYNIGLHGFFNARSLKETADEMGVHYVTMKQARKQGIEQTIKTALHDLSQKVDTIYLTVDMDVLDISFGPGAPAATPGGMYTDELFEAVRLVGKCDKVRAMDIVCLDPVKDVAQATVKAGVHVFLSFLTGYKQRIQPT